MTTLVLLASQPADRLARLGAPALPGTRRTVSTPASFDNRPTWDNWTKAKKSRAVGRLSSRPTLDPGGHIGHTQGPGDEHPAPRR
jgi:hypothetical protein